MKLVSLNLWGGRQEEILKNYLRTESANTDIFCFQEVFSSLQGPQEYNKARPRLFSELKEILQDFQAIFTDAYAGWVDMEKVDFEIFEGQALFINKAWHLEDSGKIFIFGDAETKIDDDFRNEPKIMQHAILESSSKQLFIGNFHGRWYPGDKLDTPERLRQSEIAKKFIDKYNCPKILAGDFNLMPETHSIRMLEENLKNLIKEYNITSTRNEFSWIKYHNQQNFADYTFVSREIKVQEFTVPYNLASDHLPMILQFSF